MLVILLKGCFVQYKAGGCEEENEHLFLFHKHNRKWIQGILKAVFKLVFS